MSEKSYQPVGRCIYCGSKQGKIRDEHIIPYSLGGVLILPNSSCKSCENITHRFEYTVARQIFGHFRMRHKLPTRRPKERPTHIEIGTVLPNGRHGRAKVPISKFPAPLFMYKFEMANFLLGLPPDVDKFDWVPVSIVSNEELDMLKEQYHWDGMLQFRAQPVEFARMLAKIAHSYAVAELGLETFRPLTLDIILGRTNNVSYLVGGSFEIPPPEPEGKHLLNITYQVETLNDLEFVRAIIIVGIRLFASIETPAYHVVVGDVDTKKATHVQRLIETLQNTGKAGRSVRC